MAKTAKLRLLDASEAIASINSFICSLPLDDFLANAFEILLDVIHSDLSDLKIRLENYLVEGEGV